MRMTKQRKLILDIFKNSNKPLNAEMIYDLLPKNEMNLSTVYRNLELFNLEDIISRSTIDNTNYYYLTDSKHHHYMICLECHKMIPVDCGLTHIETSVSEEHHFKITHHDMTLYGYCDECQVKLGL
ncbi:Ferric-uptake regulator [Alteracholeplasma palmae J233]|uniref:Ferric-uptake regulator n=1 Tax=Alteracholeplasma palmae (strain ATCC 49389 / J233) TaxID=1318466 RepID=U4KRB9_ALTPJ|nr:transcriptional repressor [Alteracholeplasma palmae]CCV64026.1 Ferric-uptake regulator [Alteracholeplasma palmae J233]